MKSNNNLGLLTDYEWLMIGISVNKLIVNRLEKFETIEQVHEFLALTRKNLEFKQSIKAQIDSLLSQDLPDSDFKSEEELRKYIV